MSDTQPARAFAPATVGNIICGFDIFGLALAEPGDEVEARLRSEPGVVISAVHGDGGRLPTEAARNVAGVATIAVLAESDMQDVGIEIEVWKGLPISGGMGGSAASAVAAVVAADALLQTELSPEALLRCASEGERGPKGDTHPDNIAPALHGGIVMVRPDEPGVVIPLPVPAGLSVALVHPDLELETNEMRGILPRELPLTQAVRQWADCSALVVGLYEADWDLIKRSLVDRVAEPHRKRFIPGFDAVKTAGLEAGALGVGLSGSGPSMFALCRTATEARSVAAAMAEAFAEAGIEGADTHVSEVANTGAHMVETPA
ncbi:MAG: homoserine kinase [Gemmatimonadetes bacterium]|nr:homoserine kinase [Gemmatimonadota bacterium]